MLLLQTQDLRRLFETDQKAQAQILEIRAVLLSVAMVIQLLAAGRCPESSQSWKLKPPEQTFTRPSKFSASKFGRTTNEPIVPYILV